MHTPKSIQELKSKLWKMFGNSKLFSENLNIRLWFNPLHDDDTKAVLTFASGDKIEFSSYQQLEKYLTEKQK